MEKRVKEFLKQKDICLIGFMGSGKSFMGEYLTKELDMPLIDTDDMIEQLAGMSITQIFKEKGEKHFRKLEHDLLQDLVFGDRAHTVIISMGGGMPISKINRKLMKIMNSLNICLNPPFEVILERIKGSKRPLVYRRSRKSIFNLWTERYNEYQKIANLTVSDVELGEIIKSLELRIGILINN